MRHAAERCQTLLRRDERGARTEAARWQMRVCEKRAARVCAAQMRAAGARARADAAQRQAQRARYSVGAVVAQQEAYARKAFAARARCHMPLYAIRDTMWRQPRLMFTFVTCDAAMRAAGFVTTFYLPATMPPMLLP